MIKWGFYHFNADAEKCFREIEDNLGSDYTPDQLVELAKDESTELHKCFDWDDTVAAERWRKHQARLLSGSLSVVVEREDKEPQEYKLIQHDHETQTYRSVQYTVRNTDQYDRLKAQARAELEAFRYRYRMIVEYQDVIEEIDKALAQ